MLVCARVIVCRHVGYPENRVPGPHLRLCSTLYQACMYIVSLDVKGRLGPGTLGLYVGQCVAILYDCVDFGVCVCVKYGVQMCMCEGN